MVGPLALSKRLASVTRTLDSRQAISRTVLGARLRFGTVHSSLHCSVNLIPKRHWGPSHFGAVAEQPVLGIYSSANVLYHSLSGLASLSNAMKFPEARLD
jgi:hypothetical protein